MPGSGGSPAGGSVRPGPGGGGGPSRAGGSGAMPGVKSGAEGCGSSGTVRAPGGAGGNGTRARERSGKADRGSPRRAHPGTAAVRGRWAATWPRWDPARRSSVRTGCRRTARRSGPRRAAGCPESDHHRGPACRSTASRGRQPARDWPGCLPAGSAPAAGRRWRSRSRWDPGTGTPAGRRCPRTPPDRCRAS